jgi:hypothetical protein
MLALCRERPTLRCRASATTNNGFARLTSPSKQRSLRTLYVIAVNYERHLLSFTIRDSILRADVSHGISHVPPNAYLRSRPALRFGIPAGHSARYECTSNGVERGKGAVALYQVPHCFRSRHQGGCPNRVGPLRVRVAKNLTQIKGKNRTRRRGIFSKRSGSEMAMFTTDSG